MDKRTHTIVDPDGDATIILCNPNSAFAPLSEDMIADGFSQASPKRGDDAYCEEPAIEESTVEDSIVDESNVEESTVEESAKIGIACEPPKESCFRFQVSLKHLTLASPVFKKMVTGSWKESVTYLKEGSVEINAENWDSEALLILLCVIHGQHK